MTTKQPTPQAISALLRKAGYQKAVVKLHGGSSGYCVQTDISTGNVRVEYHANTMRPSGYNTELNLSAYTRAIEKAGYEVLRPSPRCLIVTAPPAASGEATYPIPCPNCSATLYTHHHTECPRYGTEPPWEPIGSDWQFGRDDSVSLAQNRSER